MSLFSCCAPLAEESRLLRDCYPPKKQLPAGPSSPSGPATSLEDYKPLSQELSKMTYFATNKPGKLNNLARELETRVKKEAKETQAGYPKSRAMLLISLAILRSLLTECKRDLQLFAPSALRIIETAMTVALRGGALHNGRSGSVDLEIAVRAGSAFAAFTTFADGAALMGPGSDDDVGSSVYVRVLDKFAQLAVSDNASQADNEKGDNELRNRTRLIGLASVSAACHSDVMFSSSSAEFESQIKTLIPVLLQNLWLGSPAELERALAGAQLDDAASSPYFKDFEAAARPGLAQRRAPSLHAHVVGEKGPTTLDIVSASLGTLRDLLRGCYASQTASVADVLIAWLDQHQRWNGNLEMCAWTWEALLGFSNLRYRYAFPLAIVDEIAKGDARESALVSTLTSLLSAEKLSMPGLPTTKILHDLVNVIMRRAKERVDYSDIIKAAASLSVHIYYGEQVNDLVEVVIGRIASVQSSAPHILPDGTLGEPSRKNGSRSPSFTSSTEQREAVVIALIACIEAIMTATPSSQERGTKRDGRGAVSLEVWQETLPLLCDGSRAVRSAYVKALVSYLRHELPLAASAAKDTPPGTPKRWTATTTSALIRFLNALNATLYTLAVSSQLGYSGPAVGPKSEAILGGERLTDSPQADSDRQGSATPDRRPATMGRRSSKLVALPMHRTEVSRIEVPVNDSVAGQSDYHAIVETLLIVIQHDRVVSLFCCLPMLSALDRETSTGAMMAPERVKACKELIVRTCKAALTNYTVDETALHPPTMIPREPISPSLSSNFPPLNSSQASAWTTPSLVLTDVVSAVSEDPQVASTFGSERSALSEVFERSWTVQHALEASVEFFDNPHALKNRLRAPSSARRLTGDIDASLRSFNTSGQRGIDVADLREALGGGKRSASSGGVRSASGSIAQAANGTGSPHSPRSSLKSFGDNAAGRRKLKPEDAREILKDIFRDKRRSAGAQQLSAV